MDNNFEFNTTISKNSKVNARTKAFIICLDINLFWPTMYKIIDGGKCYVIHLMTWHKYVAVSDATIRMNTLNIVQSCNNNFVALIYRIYTEYETGFLNFEIDFKYLIATAVHPKYLITTGILVEMEWSATRDDNDDNMIFYGNGQLLLDFFFLDPISILLVQVQIRRSFHFWHQILIILVQTRPMMMLHYYYRYLEILIFWTCKLLAKFRKWNSSNSIFLD